MRVLVCLRLYRIQHINSKRNADHKQRENSTSAHDYHFAEAPDKTFQLRLNSVFSPVFFVVQLKNHLVFVCLAVRCI